MSTVCVVTADTSQDSLTSAVTSLDDDVKQAITTAHVPVCVRERQTVITDAREALASSSLRESLTYLFEFVSQSSAVYITEPHHWSSR